MRKKSIVYLSLSLAALLLFTLFTLALTCVDTQNVVYENGASASIGFYSINHAVFSALGASELFDTLSDLLMLAAFAVVFAFALIGVYQLFKRKKLFAVDPAILLLACFYALVVACYLLFEVLVINYRPILVDSVLAASYPSSHTLLVSAIFASAPIALTSLFGCRKLTCAASVVCLLLAIASGVLRLLSGMHWLTDVIGAFLLTAALVLLYAFFLSLCKKEKAE